MPGNRVNFNFLFWRSSIFKDNVVVHGAWTMRWSIPIVHMFQKNGFGFMRYLL